MENMGAIVITVIYIERLSLLRHWCW